MYYINIKYYIHTYIYIYIYAICKTFYYFNFLMHINITK